MKTDQSTEENPDQVTSDEQGASQVRSYGCTFCKRGFTNAQALGGHMNIHRKDKAKLKQSSNESQQSLDNPKTASRYHPLNESNSSEERSTIQWPSVLGNEDESKKDKTHVEEIWQLPLFVEKPTGKDEKLSQSPVSELDLELRLGPEPQEPSAQTSTRKFF